MTAPKPLLPLTPTERRIAEMAFATAAYESHNGSWDCAAAAVRAVMNLRKDASERNEGEDNDAMIEALRHGAPMRLQDL